MTVTDEQSLYRVQALRPNKKGPSEDYPEPVDLAESDASPETEEIWIACRNCHHRITRPSEQIAINGIHQHTFANPSGVVFEIGCYRSVQGCAMAGPPSSDFAWFAGYTWQIAICAACHNHLGWRFSGKSGGAFFGLILDRLTEISIA